MKLYVSQPFVARNSQRGVSLLMVLILLIVMSVLGIAVLRSAAMQERMTANLRDRSLSFQAAESALRYAQFTVLGDPSDKWDQKGNVGPTAADCVSKAICPMGTSPATWRTLPAGTYDSRAPTPKFWIEYLETGPGYKGSCDSAPPGLDCHSPMYRITTNSGGAGRASVTLQSIVSSRIPTPGL